MSIGKKIHELRVRKGLSQSELARQANVKQASISRCESGIAKNLRSDHLLQIAEVLGVASDVLLNDRDPSPAEYVTRDRDAHKLVEAFIQLDVTGRENLLRFAEFLKTQASNQ